MQNVIKKLNIFISYLYPIYIVALPTSLLLMEIVQYLIMLILIFILLYELIKNKKFIFENNTLNKLSLLVIVVFLFSTISSPYLLDDDVSIIKVIQKMTVFIMIPFNYLMLTKYFNMNKALKISFYTLIPISIYVLFQFFTGFNPRMNNYDINFGISKYVTGFYSNYLGYSYIFQLYLFTMFGLLIQKAFKGRVKNILLTMTIIYFITIIFSGSRMAFVTIFTGTFVLSILSKNKKLVIILLSSVFIFILSYKYNSFINRKFNHTINNINVAGDEIRYENWKANLDVFMDHPIKGIGHWINVMKMKEYFEKKKMNVKRYYIPHAHNNYLHLLSSGGIIGFVSFFILWGYIYTILFKSYFRYKRNSKKYQAGLALGILAGLSTLLINGLTECTFFVYAINNNISFFAALAYILWQGTSNLDEKNQVSKI